jgi:hypothetical protein
MKQYFLQNIHKNGVGKKCTSISLCSFEWEDLKIPAGFPVSPLKLVRDIIRAGHLRVLFSVLLFPPTDGSTMDADSKRHISVANISGNSIIFFSNAFYIERIHTRYLKISVSILVTFFIVPGHRDADDNETADQLARLWSEYPFIGPEPAGGLSTGIATKAVRDSTNRGNKNTGGP